MIRLMIFVVMIVQFNAAIANDKTYKKLNKMYKKDADKCLEMAKQILKKQPNKSEGYYFITIINKDKYMATSSISSQYGLMNQILFYASVFDVKGNVTLKEKVSWGATKNTIESEAQVLVALLMTNSQREKAKKIALKLHHLNAKYPKYPKALNPENIDPVSVDFANNNIGKELEEAHIDNYTLNAKTADNTKLYFGKPMGNEIIASHNVAAENELLRIINDARKSKGMKPLILEDQLTNAARYHAYDMATQAYFEHNTYDRVNGSKIKVATTFERIKQFYNASFVNSENIAAGNEKAIDTYNQWYNSPGHYANMFNTSSKKVGIGLIYIPNSTFGYYWVFCTAQ